MKATVGARKPLFTTTLASLLVVATFGGYMVNGFESGERDANAPVLAVGEVSAGEGLREIRSAFKIGFGPLEPDGVWMNASDALVTFRPTGPQVSLAAVFEVVPLIGGERTSLTLYSQTSGEWAVHELHEGLNQVEVALPSREVQSIAFACGKLASPSELGINSDTRPLCVKFVSIGLVRASIEPGTGLQ